MPMPKTSVHENRLPPTRKDEVGRTGKALVVKPVPKAEAMDHSANDHFGLGVAVTDHRHASAALGGIK